MLKKLTIFEKLHTHFALTFFSITSIFPLIWTLIATFTPRYDIPDLSEKMINTVLFIENPETKYFINVDKVYNQYKNEYSSVLTEIDIINNKIKNVTIKNKKFSEILNTLKLNMNSVNIELGKFKQYKKNRIHISRLILKNLESHKKLKIETIQEIEELKIYLSNIIPDIKIKISPFKKINQELDETDLESLTVSNQKVEKDFTQIKIDLFNMEKKIEEIVGVSFFHNYYDLLTETNFLTWLINTFFVAAMTIITGLFLSSTAAFAFSKFKFAGRKTILIFFLISQMFPGALLIVALYNILNFLGMLNSLWGLIITYSTFGIPFCVWMLKSFFDTVPDSILEAARIDGASFWAQFYRIILPLSFPGIAVIAFILFLGVWNEFLFALIFLTSEAKMTLAVGLRSFIGYEGISLAHLCTCSILMILPAIVVFIFAQRWIISGLTAGAVKD